MAEVFSVDHVFALNVFQKSLVDDIVFELKMCFNELFDYFLHGNIIYQSKCIQPLQALIDIHEDSPPVCSELKFIFYIVDSSEMRLLVFFFSLLGCILPSIIGLTH